MKVTLSVLLCTLLMVLTGSSPLFSRKLPDWRNPWTDVSYRERLQSWGLYPKVFRYGTTNHHAAIMERKRAELSWLKRFVRENEERRGNRPVGTVSNDNIDRERQYEKFKEKHFQKMEQEALELCIALIAWMVTRKVAASLKPAVVTVCACSAGTGACGLRLACLPVSGSVAVTSPEMVGAPARVTRAIASSLASELPVRNMCIPVCVF
uniref:Cathepsin propeptide inhibitor domain-containing protein n=1 Tax=Anopheles culicifacies TaxID=139723 RepID=A0A182MIX6_9DIPT